MNTTFVNTINTLLATYNPGTGAAPEILPIQVLQSLYPAGTWNAATNTPSLASGTGTPGAAYLVGTGGTTNLDGIATWVANDYAIFNPATNKYMRINGATGELTGDKATEDQLTAALIASGAGYKVKYGQHTMLSASDTVVTGLTTVVAAVANMESAPVLTFDRANASVGDQVSTPAAGSIILTGWMPTDSTLTTPIAATGYSGIKVNWVAVGT